MEEFVCKGSLNIGTGCKACSRCFKQMEGSYNALLEDIKQIVKYRYYMSYNDSYFGEPEGFLKSIIADIDRKYFE